ncbi:MAG: TlpA family protein disulfide reductase [Clostridia bacterium]|nr:TlpA family protein disulfide reductase [Clostridia bacterium]
MTIAKRLLLLALTAALCAFSFSGLGAESLSLGSAMPDFTVETINCGTFTLSEVLKEKKAVLINLWASWCRPCAMEFPYLQKAYELYDDVVAVIALSTERSDTPQVLTAYAEEHGLTFPIGSDSTLNFGSAFHIQGIPTSIIVDQYGNVAFIEAGAQPSVSAFSRLFDVFTSDSYTQTRVLDKIPAAKPTVAAADPAKLSEALNAEGQIVFSSDQDELAWPMAPVEKDGRTAVASTNAGEENTAAGLLAQVTSGTGDYLAFDFATDTEALFDLLVIRVDGEKVKTFGGTHDWTAWALPLEAGEHAISFRYEKDSFTSQGQDTVWLDNVRLISGDEARELLAAQPIYPTAEKTSMTVLTEGAKEIIFDDPDGVMESYYGSQSYWIVPGGAAEVFVTVSGNMDPECAFLYNNFDASTVSLPQAQTEGGYTVSTGLNSLGTTGACDTTVFLYPDAGAELGDTYYISFFSNEDDVDYLVFYFVNNILDDGQTLSWHYADSASASGEYAVRFIDQNGDPVPGCIVNFCTDTFCMPVAADETGVARFTGEPYAYHLQVLKVPAGYAFDTAQEFWTEENGGEITLTVTKE